MVEYLQKSSPLIVDAQGNRGINSILSGIDIKNEIVSEGGSLYSEQLSISKCVFD